MRSHSTSDSGTRQTLVLALPDVAIPPFPIGVEMGFDKVQFRSPSAIPNPVRAELRQHCREFVSFASDPDSYGFRYVLTVPTGNAFSILQEWSVFVLASITLKYP